MAEARAKMTKDQPDYDDLIAKYPHLFEGIQFGIQCGDGWFSLIDELCQHTTNWMLRTGYVCKATQVKEKFGGLRFYVSQSTLELDEVIDKAEELSYTICETCGQPGKLNEGPWYKVRCGDCND